jgi:Ni,Fe-hydrogenase III large subunit
VAILANDASGQLELLRTTTGASRSFPSLTPLLPQAQAFERDLFERCGPKPEGHPWLKSLRRHAELERNGTGGPAAAEHPFFQVQGEDIHEVAVGPVHAGIIEPGHFRFQCLGETVEFLEIQLGYQSRGAEELLLRGTDARRVVVAESIAGDTAVGHATAFCSAIEGLAEREIPLNAQRIRGIALELERLANHVGDLGALCNDIGYLPGASWFGRLRGEFLNMLCTLSGNRFGRGLVVPGGVRFGLDERQRGQMLEWLAKVEARVNGAADLVFDSGSVCSRFEQTGTLQHATAEALGIVGTAARASGCNRDVRSDHAYGIYRYAHIPVSVSTDGDVMARAYVRWLEAQRSIQFIREELEQRCDEHLRVDPGPCSSHSLVVSMVETWRGEAVHLLVTGDQGRWLDYRVVDPSFHNWMGLAMAMRGQQISDFPLCNKSFNLSYAGHDL